MSQVDALLVLGGVLLAMFLLMWISLLWQAHKVEEEHAEWRAEDEAYIADRFPEERGEQ